MGYQFSGNLQEDEAAMVKLFANCADIKKKEMKIGKHKGISCFLIYIEVTLSSVMLRTTALGNFLARLSEVPEEQIPEILRENGMGLSDVMLYDTAEEAGAGLLTGDAILVVDGFPMAM